VARYESRVGDNHHHVVSVVRSDRRCRLRGGQHAVPNGINNHGFVIDEAEVTYWACAPTVQTRKVSDPPAWKMSV